eukprot:738105-Lingulodinium_polyedra.AAC.1
MASSSSVGAPLVSGGARQRMAAAVKDRSRSPDARSHPESPGGSRQQLSRVLASVVVERCVDNEA